jgi:hypothetical protein
MAQGHGEETTVADEEHSKDAGESG